MEGKGEFVFMEPGAFIKNFISIVSPKAQGYSLYRLWRGHGVNGGFAINRT